MPHIDAEMSAEPMPFDCERIVCSGSGWLITMEELHDETSKNTICLWYDADAEDAARFYAKTFLDSFVGNPGQIYLSLMR